MHIASPAATVKSAFADKKKAFYAVYPLPKRKNAAEKLAATLPREIAIHCNAYQVTEKRLQSITAWAALFALVRKNWGVTPTVSFEENGKPTVCVNGDAATKKDLYISLSHTDGAVAGCAAQTPCGIDIERALPRENAEKLLTRFFAEELPSGGSPLSRFYFAFTAREAVGKLSGGGVLTKNVAKPALVYTQTVRLSGENYVLSFAGKEACSLKKVRLGLQSK